MHVFLNPVTILYIYIYILVMCNSGDISIYRDMKFYIVIKYEVLSIVIIPFSVFY